MKRHLLALVMACALSAQALAFDRVINESWDISRTPRTPLDIYWMQAESIQFNLSVHLAGTPYSLTNENLLLVWELTGTNDFENIYSVSTGTVADVTNGVYRFELTPEQSNLTNGVYSGYARALLTDGTNTTHMVVLSRQRIFVAWSPAGLEYAYSGWTAPPFYTREETDDLLSPLTAGLAAVEAQTNSWNTAYGWGDHAGLYPVLSAWSATNAAQYSVNTNYGARIAALEGAPAGVSTSSFVNVSNRVVTLESGTSTWNTVTGKVDQAAFNATNTAQYIVNTNLQQRVTTLEGGTTITNLNVFQPNDVVVLRIDCSAFTATNAGSAEINGTYTNLNGLTGQLAIYTNLATGSYSSFYSGHWRLTYGGSVEYYYGSLGDPQTNPWEEPTWSVWDGTPPAPTVTGIFATNIVASLSNSWQWVSAPTGSTSSGEARQIAVPADTNQFLYFFQPAAVSGSTTGIWLRVLGETF